MKMKTNKKLLSLIALSLLLAKPYNVFAADADSFRTDEYYGMDADPLSAQANKNGALDIINAAAAYAQGYTGKGVTVGVADAGTVNFSHPEFSGKTGSGVVFDGLESSDVPLTWEKLYHPTYVAGITAADKNGFGMHGVAYDADIASSSAIRHYFADRGFESGSSFYDNYLTNPDIKIINNSWATRAYLSNVNDKRYFELLKNFVLNDVRFNPIYKAVNNDKLLIFGSGNSGHLTAAQENDLDVLSGEKAFNDNIITVTAAKANSFKKNNNGGFDVESDAIAIWSDLAMYNEDTTLCAPGWYINSAYADFAESGEYYYSGYGTSISAPMVTGVGALVQQVFPYLSGKQIGDVLLSTANNDIETEKDYFVTIQMDDYNRSFNVYFTGEAPSVNDKWEIIYEYYNEHKDVFLEYFCNNDKTVFDYFFGSTTNIE